MILAIITEIVVKLGGRTLTDLHYSDDDTAFLAHNITNIK